MAGVVIAPWLETKPADFLAAEEAGARTGLEARGQDIEQQSAQARQSQMAAELQQNSMLEQQKLATARKIASDRLGLQTQIASRKFAQQQAYQKAIAGGMDPIQAMMSFGPTMGQSMAGVGQLGMMQSRDKMASLPPQFVTDPNDPNRTLGVTYGGQFHAAAMPRTATAKPGIGAQARLKALETAYTQAVKLGDDAKASSIMKQLESAADEIDNPDSQDETDDGTAQAEVPATDNQDPLGLFTQSQ